MFFKLKDTNFESKKVLIRVDYNVPIKNSVITDDMRIKKSLSTIRYVLDNGASQVILVSHLGRPKGEYTPEFSLKPVADRLGELLEQKVVLVSNPRITNITELPPDKVVVLENLRFEKYEEENDEVLAKKLASLCDVFVFDAFGVSHREHASVVGVPRFVRSCSGLLMEEEIEYLTLESPKRPFVAIVGGAKSDKIGVIKSLIERVDTLIIGGVLANTFLKAKGEDIGNSKYTKEDILVAKDLLKDHTKKIALPVDFIVGKEFSEDTESRVLGIHDDLTGWMILDIGPYTISGYKKILCDAKTIVWGGPIGAFEFEKFRRGTWDVANYMSGLSATKIIGGGDSADAINLFNLTNKMTHVSTGGGASLEVLAGHVLPAVTALEENYGKYQNIK